MDPKEASKGLGFLLSEGGDFLMEGISKGGKFLGEAFDKAGDLVKGWFSKNEKETEVKQSTIEKLRYANKTSTRIKEYTSAQISNMLDFAGGLAKDAVDE